MIDGSRILTKFSLQPLAVRLGVEGIVRAVLDPVVHPVAIVDGSIQAFGLQLLDVPFTAGELAAPAANTRLANTGALTAGQYNITALISWTQDSNRVRIRRRNAADGADIWSQQLVGAAGAGMGICLFDLTLRLVFAANEFLVIENVAAGVAGSLYQASIWVQGPF
jgi:hypothetical protein